MTTRELIARLQELDPSGEMLVTEKRCSDYGPMDGEDWSVTEFYPQQGGAWYTKTDYRRETGKTDMVRTVLFLGN